MKYPYLLLILFICSCHFEGTIVDKVLIPEKNWTTTEYITVGNVHVPNTVHHTDPKHWEIKVSRLKPHSHKLSIRTFRIDYEQGDNYQLGNNFKQ